ncbi:MAG: hypothetical protein WCK96_15795 [Methylococcales bacterium]
MRTHDTFFGAGKDLIAQRRIPPKKEMYVVYGRWCMNKVICNQCVTPFICDVFSKKRLFLIKNHQSNKYNPLIYLYFVHAPTPCICAVKENRKYSKCS